jgi:hypothetical protein
MKRHYVRLYKTPKGVGWARLKGKTLEISMDEYLQAIRIIKKEGLELVSNGAFNRDGIYLIKGGAARYNENLWRHECLQLVHETKEGLEEMVRFLGILPNNEGKTINKTSLNHS